MPLFKSANSAVRWAINYGTDGHIERSAMNKLSNPSVGADSELEQGQAGAILAMIKGTGEFHEACLVARSAVHRTSCACGAPCCSKSKPNWIWHESVNYITMEVKRLIDSERRDGTRGATDNPAMRRALVAKFFGERIRINELAKACEVVEATVATHHGKITKIIKKTEGSAWELIEERLRLAGLID
ncbi:MAG TPA: hypothetical protein VMW50_02460 [Dehalococcoidia bacterium]|nr:hypothetical protein [Dehalococcoidia bacterium]